MNTDRLFLWSRHDKDVSTVVDSFLVNDTSLDELAMIVNSGLDGPVWNIDIPHTTSLQVSLTGTCISYLAISKSLWMQLKSYLQS